MAIKPTCEKGRKFKTDARGVVRWAKKTLVNDIIAVMGTGIFKGQYMEGILVFQ